MAEKKEKSSKTKNRQQQPKRKKNSLETSRRPGAAAGKSGTRRSSAKKTAPPSQGRGRLGAFIAIIILAALVISGYLYLYARHHGWNQEAQPEIPVKSPKVVRPLAVKPFTPPKFEIYPVAPHPVPEQVPGPPPAPGNGPRIAIIIDDIGYDTRLAEKFIDLDSAITISILPYSPHGRALAAEARRKGHTVMLHLPMEPMEYPDIDPGPGAILSSMTPDERIAAVKKAIKAVPYIEGVNNHMGSRVTADSDQMNQVMSIIKKYGLFFVDSRTTPYTTALSSARLFRVPFAQRDVFLDHDPTPEAIRRQVEDLLEKGRQKGYAIGIGHPHEATWKVLSEMMGEIRSRARLVPVSDLVVVHGP